MKTYQIKLVIYSGILTPFQADTIFGHLCWVVAYQEGEKGLQEFLKPFNEGNPPFIISDGFPVDLLPKPLSVEFNIDPDKRKDVRKIDFLTQEDFNRIRKAEGFEIKHIDNLIKTSLATHNTINRLTNTTPTEGGVYSLKETFIPNVTVYVKVISEEWKDRVVKLFEGLSNAGYGRKKSIGKGHFTVIEVIDFAFPIVEGANGFVTLSNFCPAENDPTEGLYKTLIKYGKLGEEFTFCGNPFKKPLVMIKTASVFKTGSQPKEFYGCMVKEVSPAKPEVVHYGYAFAVPMILRGSTNQSLFKPMIDRMMKL